MTWYSARLLYESALADAPSTFEDRIIVLTAPDEEGARQKAAELARAGEARYRNVYDESVHWKFIELLELCELFDDELVDGSEVYFTFLNDVTLDHVRKSLDFKFDD